MATILNNRDTQLQSTVPRTIKMGSDYIKLDSPYQYFKISESGTSSPTSINITATLVGGLVGTPVFTVESGTATISQVNNVCTIQYSNMSTDTITILASLTYAQNTYETRYTISKVRDGAAGGYTLIPDLLSEADVVAASSSGTGYTLPSGNAVKLYRGEAVVSGGVTYTVSAPSTKNGLTASIDSSGAITLSGTSWTSDTETFTFVATYNTVPYPVLYTIAKSKAGSDAIIVDLVSENDVIAANNDGSGYTLPSGNYLRLYKGGVILSSGVTYSGGTTKSGLTLAIDSATGAITLSGTSWSSNAETFTLTAAYASVNYTTTYKITKAKAGATGAPGTPGAPGAQGSRGSVRLSGTAASAAWSDTTANAVLTSAGYTTKVIGDIVTLSYSTTWTLTKFWDGSAWVVLSELVDGNLLVTGSIVGNKLAANTVTAEKIDSRGLSIKDASGNIILAAGTALTTSYISGLGSLATQNSVTTSQVSGLGTLATKSSVSATTEVTGLGNFATLNQITLSNVSTYIASAAIGSAYIGDLSAAKITSGTMTADRVTGGTLTGATINIADSSGGWVFKATSGVTESVQIWRPVLYNCTVGNVALATNPAITVGSVSLSSQPAIRASAGSGHAIETTGSISISTYLNTGTYVNAGSYVQATNGSFQTGGTAQAVLKNTYKDYYLAIQNDGNFVMYRGATAVWSTGAATSDRNLKDSITPTRINGLSIVNSFNVMDFTWKQSSDLYDGGLVHTSLIAQDVEPLVPDAVKTFNNIKIVNKEELIPYLIKAIQELSMEVTELKARL